MAATKRQLSDSRTRGSGDGLDVVSFLLTDVVASTQLWRDPALAAPAMSRHRELLGAAIAAHGGVQPPDQGEGDSTLSAFDRPSDAVAAALDAQRALSAEAWPEGVQIEVRMAVHTGEAQPLAGGNYGGLALIRAARLRSLAHGRQVLLSGVTAELVTDRMPEGATLLDLGRASLPGLERPEHAYQLQHPELPMPAAHLGALRSSSERALAAWPTPLIGRERERSEVNDLLAKGATQEGRLITITGAGGAGKTRLAHAVAEGLADRFADGIVWVELARLANESQIASAVLAACGAAEAPGIPVLELLVRWLSKTELLLVLDNCEHVLDSSAELAQSLLASAPGVRILTTSREALGIPGETSWRIPSLRLPAEGERSLESIRECAAVRLFAERATASHHEFALNAKTAPPVTRICRRLDGIPLAIELAAARVRALSVERIADALDDRFRLLTGGARTAVPRHRALRASVEWSYDLLDEDERRLFRRLSVFASPFTLEAVEAVAADEGALPFGTLDLVARLVDKSLIVHTDDRYRLLETLRQFALECVDHEGGLEALRDRHLAWFGDCVRSWRLDRVSPTRAVMQEVSEQRPDLLAALEWSQTPGRRLELSILDALGWYWFLNFGGEELRAAGGRVLSQLSEGSLPWLEALATIASALFFAGEVSWLASAQAGLLEHGDALSLDARSRLESAAGIGAASHGDPAGFAGWRHALGLARKAGDHREAELSGGYAIMLAQVGRIAEARPVIERWEQVSPKEAALAFPGPLVRSWMALFRADFATARSLLARIDDHQGAFGWQALLALWSGDLPLAHEARATLERLPFIGAFENFAAITRATVSILEEDEDSARRVLADTRENPPIGTNAYWPPLGLAELALSAGDVAEAAALRDDLVARLAGREIPLFQSWVHDLSAHVSRAQGEPAAAEASAHASLELAQSNELALLETEALETLVVLAAEAGRPDEAARLLGATEHFRAERGYNFRWSHRRRAIDGIRSSLSAEPLAEGATLSLDEAADYVRRGRGARGRPTAGWESLTPTEARVVELASTGLSNKDLAAKLFVSVATVKTHLVHIFAKLDVRSRAELAAKVAARGLS